MKRNSRNDKATRRGVCRVCKQRGFIMWYKAQTSILKKLDPLKQWKQEVCNHFREGQSKDRNYFHYIPNTVREALPDEVITTYHIFGREAPP